MNRFLVICCVIMLAACGGGSGGSPPPSGDQDFGGLWSGTLSFDGPMADQELVAITLSDNRFRLVAFETGMQLTGTVEIDGTSVLGIGAAWPATGEMWGDGSLRTDLEITAMIIEADSFSGSWTTMSGESGSFVLDYDPDYERDASITLIEGGWTIFDEFLNPITTFTVDSTGQFNGQNTLGCTSLGQITVPDPQVNVYEWSGTISNCILAGNYNGLGALGDVNATNDAFFVAVNSPILSVVLPLQR